MRPIPRERPTTLWTRLMRGLVPGGLMLVVLGGAVRGESQTPPVAPQFVLIGTVVTDSRALAYLQEPSLTGSGPLRVPLGERIGPYRLTKVLGDRVELEGPAGVLTVRLGGAATAASRPVTPQTPPTVTAAPATRPPPPPGVIEMPKRQMGFGAILQGVPPPSQ